MTHLILRWEAISLLTCKCSPTLWRNSKKRGVIRKCKSGVKSRDVSVSRSFLRQLLDPFVRWSPRWPHQLSNKNAQGDTK
jgi:hypothetical protein